MGVLAEGREAGPRQQAGEGSHGGQVRQTVLCSSSACLHALFVCLFICANYFLLLSLLPIFILDASWWTFALQCSLQVRKFSAGCSEFEEQFTQSATAARAVGATRTLISGERVGSFVACKAYGWTLLAGKRTPCYC